TTTGSNLTASDVVVSENAKLTDSAVKVTNVTATNLEVNQGGLEAANISAGQASFTETNVSATSLVAENLTATTSNLTVTDVVVDNSTKLTDSQVEVTNITTTNLEVDQGKLEATNLEVTEQTKVQNATVTAEQANLGEQASLTDSTLTVNGTVTATDLTLDNTSTQAQAVEAENLSLENNANLEANTSISLTGTLEVSNSSVTTVDLKATTINIDSKGTVSTSGEVETQNLNVDNSTFTSTGEVTVSGAFTATNGSQVQANNLVAENTQITASQVEVKGNASLGETTIDSSSLKVAQDLALGNTSINNATVEAKVVDIKGNVTISDSNLEAVVTTINGTKVNLSNTEVRSTDTTISAQEATLENGTFVGTNLNIEANETNVHDSNLSSVANLSIGANNIQLNATNASAENVTLNATNSLDVSNGSLVKAVNLGINASNFTGDVNAFQYTTGSITCGVNGAGCSDLYNKINGISNASSEVDVTKILDTENTTQIYSSDTASSIGAAATGSTPDTDGTITIKDEETTDTEELENSANRSANADADTNTEANSSVATDSEVQTESKTNIAIIATKDDETNRQQELAKKGTGFDNAFDKDLGDKGYDSYRGIEKDGVELFPEDKTPSKETLDEVREAGVANQALPYGESDESFRSVSKVNINAVFAAAREKANVDLTDSLNAVEQANRENSEESQVSESDLNRTATTGEGMDPTRPYGISVGDYVNTVRNLGPEATQVLVETSNDFGIRSQDRDYKAPSIQTVGQAQTCAPATTPGALSICFALGSVELNPSVLNLSVNSTATNVSIPLAPTSGENK
ncbi:beta strand repeat-containing protein, partial [Psittacicella gerlachiana]